jgi:hypothetical protein
MLVELRGGRRRRVEHYAAFVTDAMGVRRGGLKSGARNRQLPVRLEPEEVFRGLMKWSPSLGSRGAGLKV